MIKIYTDGSAEPNPGEGGWAAIIISKEIKEISGYEPQTTNNRMEMLAAIKGLEFLNEPSEVELYSDSAYLVNCFLQKWYLRWQQNGWLNSRAHPVENKDLWERLLELTSKHQVRFVKVKGHKDDEYNNRCDELAAIARQKKSNSSDC